jgi:N-acetylneuraminic acid mutarotase
MPTALYSPRAVGINGILYVVGGNNGGSLPTVRSYNPATDSWAPLADLPGGAPYNGYGRYNGAIETIGGLLYYIGGWQTSPPLPSSALQVYNPATDSWSTKASLGHLSACGAAGAINGKLYVYTACNGSSGYYSIFDVYDPVFDSWSTLPGPRVHSDPVGGVINGKFYLAGGLDGSGTPTGALDIYDPGLSIWSAGASTPTQRSTMSGGVINGRLYVVGGINGSALGTVEAYDPANGWSTATPMPTSRYGMAGAVIGNSLYVAGGAGVGGAIVSTLEVFTPKADQTITFGIQPDRILGQPPFTVSATASSSLAVAFSAAGTCTVAGSTVTLTAAGTCSITASQSGNNAWNPAPNVTRSFQVMTPAQFSQSLVATVQALALNPTVTNALTPTLFALTQALAAGNTAAACSQIAVFNAQVVGFTGSQITMAQAQTLLGALAILAQAIRC